MEYELLVTIECDGELSAGIAGALKERIADAVGGYRRVAVSDPARVEVMPRMRLPGAVMIAEERNRQITEEHWTLRHDDQHDGGELADAACVYASPRRLYVKADGPKTVCFMDPWPNGWTFRSATARLDGLGLGLRPVREINSLQRPARIRDLVKAGALIAAEIDRLHRQTGVPS